MTYQWDHPDTDPVGDLKAVTKEILEACHWCAGYKREIYIDQTGHQPRLATRPCSGCNGTGKRPEFREGGSQP